MTPRQILFYILIALIMLSGCVTIDDPKNYQPFASSSDIGRVCLYRIAPRSTPGTWMDWVLDGRWSAQIRPGAYTCMETHVGRHIVRVGGRDENLEFKLEKDQRVYIRFEVEQEKGIYPILVEQQTAENDFKSEGWDINHLSTEK